MPLSFLSSPFIEKLGAFSKQYERRVLFLALFGGFVWDSLTLGRPDGLYENIILGSYLVLSAGCILLLNTGVRDGGPHTLPLLTLLQFSFGNLAGGLIILYGKSGTFEGSALFFLLFFAFFAGNELLRSRYSRVRFHLSAWYFLLLSYMTLIVPVFFGAVGEEIFLWGAVASVACVTGFLALMNLVASKNLFMGFGDVALPLGSIFLIFNMFYFLNILPPVPLSLKTIGVYHSVERLADGNYMVRFEAPKWYEFYRDTHTTYHLGARGGVYCFSSVFAPTGLRAPIFHRFEFYNESVGEWVTEFRISFPIVGGREVGYRGYSQKENVREGRWRCSVETERGTLIGRNTFRVVESGAGVVLQEKVL